MKKEYTKPTTEVVDLKMNHCLLVESLKVEGEYEEGMEDL